MSTATNNSLPPAETPVEKLLLRGAVSLTDMELICVLLGTGLKGKNVFETATHLLGLAGGLQGLTRKSAHEIMGPGGIGRMKASRIAAALEIGRRAAACRAGRGSAVRSSKDIHTWFASSLSHLEKEIFMVLGLSSKNRIIVEHRAAEGCLNECPISPREVFGPLLKCPAAAAVLVHNHPSGDPSPSTDDRLLTVRMCEAGRLLGIKVLDHVIVGSSRYYSFKDDGVIA
ncbi:MAG: DNA repair protein RadC [Pseudomonadota bacterium]